MGSRTGWVELLACCSRPSRSPGCLAVWLPNFRLHTIPASANSASSASGLPAEPCRLLPACRSSRGSLSADSSEALAVRLAHPLCLVSEIQLRPFKAWFQQVGA